MFPQTNHFSSVWTWYSRFCATGSHPSRLKVIYSQKCTFIHCPWSFLIQTTPQRTSACELFSIMSCVKKKVTKKHSNALKLKCAPGSNSKVSCQFWRKVSKSLCLKQGVWGMLSAQPCVSFLKSLIFSCVGEGTGHLPVGAHQIDLLFGMPNSVV